ncbi:MAG TPA: PCMD domain-containing protein [Bacteroidales bacterium]|nr:PCMD domain-containing protein [Bacteroidales bacterium]
MIKTVCFSILLCVCFWGYSQTIPNYSFEDWYTASAGHEDPVSWNTANPTTNVFPIYKITTEKTTDSYDGNYAAKLTSKTIMTFVAPGFITLGDFTIDIWTQETSITGGIDFNLKPDKLKLWYKYIPVGNDMMRIGLWMLRNDGSEIPDTVATALFETHETQNTYSQLIVDIEYRNDFNPEILNIMSVSSNPDNPVAESVLYIDKIELDYNTGIITNNISDFNIYPSPTNNYIFLNNCFNNCKYYIYDLVGKKISENIYTEPINVSEFTNGTYLISVEFNGILHTQKFIKQ